MDVVLSVSAGGWNRWGERFVKRQPLSRIQHLIPAAVTAEAAKLAIIKAVTAAGAGGRVIMNVGHGAGGGPLLPTEGSFEMAPGGTLRIGGRGVQNCFVDVFYDVKPSAVALSDLEFDQKNNPTSQRLAHWQLYQEIAAAFKKTKPRELILLTCRVGNATEFLRKVANDWGVVITAYRQRVALTEDVVTSAGKITRHFYLHLENDNPLTKLAADLVIYEEEIPLSSKDTFRVGPPLN
ncbi:MAG: hypothetical protein EOO52_01570 [Gammaproteobacteria bacterium]|nr:MAG: hypothetical protein EOO52_01570 [Gammaproteobacteria bacterium]